MIRDLELIRNILIHIDENIGYRGQFDFSTKYSVTNLPTSSLIAYVSDYVDSTEEFLLYHLDLLYESGMFMDGVHKVQALGSISAHFSNISLSSKGHDFLASICYKDIFEQIKEATTTSIGQFFFQITGAFAELERNLIKERTKAGLEAARARGKKGGRKPLLSKKQIQMMTEIYNAKSTSIIEICEQFKISRKTFYRYLKSI